jgi:hypothetical protein
VESLIRANSWNSWPVISKNRREFHEFQEANHLTVVPRKGADALACPGTNTYYFRLIQFKEPFALVPLGGLKPMEGEDDDFDDQSL